MTRKRPLLRWDGIFANADSESRSWFNFHPEILLFEHFVDSLVTKIAKGFGVLFEIFLCNFHPANRICLFSPRSLGKIFILTHIFQRG